MKKGLIITLVCTMIAGSALAKPANPRWLQELAAQGDKTTLERVQTKNERTIGEKARQRMIESGELNVEQAAAPAVGPAKTAMPLNIAPRGLIILVNFSNLSWTTATHAEMDSMITGHNYTRNYTYTYMGMRINVTASGSARKYFVDSSNGQYEPQFTVVGPVTVSKTYSYYGQNDSGGDDMHPEEMVAEACRLADAQGIDFSQYDNDGDGDIDFVYIFYAGNQESDGSGDNYIWPHSYALEHYYYLSTREGGLGNSAVMLDGKRLNKYACSGEIEAYSNQHDGIGTFCHEFSHVLGLPDLYVTDYKSSQKTMGDWDILDSGPYNNEGNTPPLYSAYEQFFMGWLTPTVLNDTGTYSLTNLAESRQAYLICSGGQHNLVGNDPNPTTFYMLENRQLSGWDSDLPGHGMIITKIAYDHDKWENNVVNNTTGQMGVDLMEADGSAPSQSQYNPDNGYSGKASDAFPAGATSFSKISGYPINNIREQNGVVTFHVGNGSSGGGGGGQGGGGTTGGGTCDNYSWTASHKLDAGEQLLDDYTWNVEAPSGAYFGYENTQTNARGAQFGSSKNPVQQVSLTTSEVANCLISSVEVKAAQGRDGNSKLSVFIGGTQIGSEKSLTTSTASYVFNNSAALSGNLEVRITNTKKAAYIKSINITQMSTSTGAEQAAEQPNVQKLWRNGQLVIIRDGQMFDVLGRSIQQ